MVPSKSGKQLTSWGVGSWNPNDLQGFSTIQTVVVSLGFLKHLGSRSQVSWPKVPFFKNGEKLSLLEAMRLQMLNWGSIFIAFLTRWAPEPIVKSMERHGGPYKWPYKLVTGAINHIYEVEQPHFWRPYGRKHIRGEIAVRNSFHLFFRRAQKPQNAGTKRWFLGRKLRVFPSEMLHDMFGSWRLSRRSILSDVMLVYWFGDRWIIFVISLYSVLTP